MNKHKGLNMNIGTASIMLVLLIFVLVAFSVRSIKAANNELRLANKSVSSIQEYYTADAGAENIIYLIDEMMISEDKDKWEGKIVELNKQFEQEYDLEKVVMNIDEEENIIYSFAIKMGETMKLQVGAKVSKGEKRCSIIEWRIVSERQDETYELEDDVELWDGIID